jgi:uncharacterized protein (TIGR03118 family)
MKVIRWLPIGLLVTGVVGVGIGCGEDGTSTTATTTTTATTSALAMHRASAFEAKVREKDLATDQTITKDPPLANAWGLAFDPKTAGIWISVNGSGSAQLFDEDGHRKKSVLLGVDDPTGVVFNGTKGFKGDDLIFASESGIIVGMQDGGSTVTSRFSANDAANYKGLAVTTSHGMPRLFAADFHGGKVDILDGDYNAIDANSDGLRDVLQDPTPHPGFGPFNVLAFGEHLIVAYAKQDDPADPHDDVRGPGNGFIDLFDADGTFVQRLLSGDGQHPELSSPWAMALSADKDDRGSVDLMIGNFGAPDDGFTPNLDGLINVYELSHHGKHLSTRFEGHLADKTGAPLNIDGLWGFIFGNGRNGFGRDDIYFAAGPQDETAGLFGELDFISRRR